MKRTRRRKPGMLNKIKFSASARNADKIIPHLNLWPDFYDSEYIEDQEEVISLGEYLEFKDRIQSWLTNSTQHTVFVDLTNLFRGERQAFYYIRDVVNLKYKHHFNRVLKVKNVPATMFRQGISVFPSDDKVGTVTLTKPFRKKIGKSTTIIFRGVLLQGYDIKILLALSQLMGRKPLVYLDNEFIKLTTSYKEICKEMLIKNPWDKEQHQTIHNSLMRLRDCGITWKTQKGHTILSGVLVKAKEINKPDVTGDLEIFFDYDFIKLFDGGFVNINPKLLYKMSEKKLALCMFLASQDYFNKKGRYPDPRFKKFEDLTDFYEKVYLRGYMTSKDKYTMKFELTCLLEKCKQEIIGDYVITKNNQVSINGKGEVFKTENHFGFPDRVHQD